METVFIGIPVYNRLDLLTKCIERFDYPSEVLVLNNNSTNDEFKRELDWVAKRRGLQVLHQLRNLGVSASWNLIISFGLSRGYEWVFIGSNDTHLYPGSLKAAIELPKEDDFGIWHLHAFNFFLLHRKTIERVGWFDENFYPAYKEDQDYSYRCQLAKVKRLPGIPGCCADHVGSATIKSDPSFFVENAKCIAKNTSYYLEKWGGDAEEELFTHPYNDRSHDYTWWRSG